MELAMAATLAGVALSLMLPSWLRWTIAFLWLTGFASATQEPTSRPSGRKWLISATTAVQKRSPPAPLAVPSPDRLPGWPAGCR